MCFCGLGQFKAHQPRLHPTDTFITLCRSKTLSRSGGHVKDKNTERMTVFQSQRRVCSRHIICLLSSRATQLMTNVTVIQIQRLKTLNTENSLSFSNHAYELSPVIKGNQHFLINAEMQFGNSILWQLNQPPFYDFTDSGLYASGWFNWMTVLFPFSVSGSLSFTFSS